MTSRHILALTSGAILLAMTGTVIFGQAGPPAGQAPRNVIDVGRTTDVHITQFPERHLMTSGISQAGANTVSRSVYAMALNNSAGPPDTAEAGFRAKAIHASQDMPGVQLSCTAEITSVHGKASLALGIVENGTYTLHAGVPISSAGTTSVSTTPFALSAGTTHQAVCYIWCRPPAGQGAYAMGKITQIKWDL